MRRLPWEENRVLCLSASLVLLFLGVAAGLVWAGGNTQRRNPSNLSEVFNVLRDERMLPLTWVMSQDGLPGSGIDNATLIAELTAAFDAWEALPTSTLDFEFGGEVPLRSSGLGGPLGPGIDGYNLVTFTDPDVLFPLEHVLAVTITFSFTEDTVIDSSNSDLDGDGTPDIAEGVYPAGTIFDSDIVFNSSHDWQVSGANGTADIRAVAMHEIGHAVGLSHSSIRNAVMWPFLDHDITAARTLKPDDIAYASFFYPEATNYPATFGNIRGRIINGFNGAPILGAHVFAVDPPSGTALVGAYSGDDGSYVIPGLVDGNYLVAIEPLDGDPVGLDPSRINEVIQFTFDTNFPEEFYDANEASVEADPLAGLAVPVAAGGDTTDIDLITNTVQVPGISLILNQGYNLFAYPVTVPTGLGAFDLLQALGDETEVNAIDRFTPATSSFERAEYVDGSPAGVNFPIRRGEGYIVHMAVQKVVSFSGATDCPELDLARGLNLVGVPCSPAGYTAFRLLQDLGAPFEIRSLERFDAETESFQVAAYDDSEQPSGDDFPISNGEGYIVNMLADKTSIPIPSPGSSFAPVITGLSPGRGVPGTIVVILGDGFDPDVTQNAVSFNGIGAGVIFATSTTITTTVPSSATTGPVLVRVNGLTSNAMEFTVENAQLQETSGSETELVSGQTVEGSLSADGEQDRYTFTALAGSLVTMSAESLTPGVPDLVLLLENPFGAVIATDDNSGGGTDPRINNFELQTTGTHTIVVTNVPGSGAGAYRLRLTITTRTAEPRVSILGGNYQTGQGGTTLPMPLSVLVSGATGAPIAGIPVTFVATEASFGESGVTPANVGTTVINTNASGIATVQTTLPASDGGYTITVTTPGAAAPATFLIAATDKAIASVQMNGDQQSGTVAQALANPLEIVLKDSAGAPVGGGLVAFEVASGGGTVNVVNPTPPLLNATLTDAVLGSASALYTLGTKIDQAQLVAAFVPGLLKPLLFEAVPEADAPSSVQSNKSNFNRLTLGTSVLNAMRIQVFDQFDNPVKDATVNYLAPSGLSVEPGLGPGGVFFTDFKTNEDGLHVAMLTAQRTAMPTLNEFGDRVAGVLNVTATVMGGSSPGETYVVDIDMGPSMVTASMQNASECIGQPLASPVLKLVRRFERRDTFSDADGDGKDDDNGDFRDEDFTDLVEKGVRGVTINTSVRREDGKDEAAVGLTPTTLGAPMVITDNAGLGRINVTRLGDVGGVNKVVGEIDQIMVEWRFADGTLLDQKTFTDGKKFAEATNLITIPIVITTLLEDAGSGLDFRTVNASVNGNAFFAGTAPPAVPPAFPEKLEVIVGGSGLENLSPALVNDSAFTQIQLKFHPAATNLTMGTNLVQVQPLTDRAGNQQNAATVGSFSYPCVDTGENGPPVLVPIGNRTVDEGATLIVPLVASDPDGDTLTLSVSGQPAFCALSDNGDGTGNLTCNPGVGTTGGYQVTVGVTDNGSPNLQDSETFTITVGDFNQPPVLDTIGAQSVDEGMQLTVPLSSSDPDGDTLTLSASGLPAFCMPTDNGDGSGSLSCNPGSGDDGMYPVLVTVTDDGTPNLSDSETFTITVVNTNGPPSLTPVLNQSVNKGATGVIPLSASDPDGDALSLFATGLPGFCTLTDNGDGTGEMRCTPVFGDEGVYSITVTATDDGTPNLSDTTSFNLTVMNRPPELGAIGSRTVDEGVVLHVTLSASDPDGDNLTFSTTGLPSFCTLTDNSDGTGSIDCTPDFSDSGAYAVTVTVTDDGSPNLPDSETVTITVNNVPIGGGNLPPELDPIGDQTVDECATLPVPLMASDANPTDMLTFSEMHLPAFCMLTDNGDGTGSIDCTPANGDDGVFTVTITVTDDGLPNLTDNETFDITVNDLSNCAPVLESIGNRSVDEGATLAVPLLSSDPDMHTLILSETGLPAFCMLTDNGDGTGSIDCTPANGDDGVYPVTVTVTDDGTPNLADSEMFDITVQDTIP